ncbi:uncharacterized protein LOC122001524 isoform X1 [Zingiber officinale]|uniref:uncharacterized protein LOC122001524 isoform X1 n=1 Tax=Zingiber officinale TaxID=94328 RepID=UPI001C4B54D5|nr:uncharacterized protein LOC122001524 isoform X1 [Zingiber officinale]
MKKRRGIEVSAAEKVDGLNKDMKRRLIMSDSECNLDDCLASLRRADRGVSRNGDNSICGEDNEAEMKEEEENADVDKKEKVLKSYEGTQTDEVAVSCKKEVLETELERKCRIESSRAEVQSEKSKLDSSEQGGKKKFLSGGNMSKTVISDGVDEKEEMNVHKEGSSKSSVPAKRKRGRVMENQTLTNLQKTGKTETEKNKLIESPDKQKLEAKDNSSCVTGDRAEDIGVSRPKDDILRMQGKSGVLRVLPSNKKVDGLENHSKRNYEEVSKAISSRGVATRAALKQQSLSPFERVDENSSLGASPSKNELRKSKKDSLKKSANRRETLQKNVFHKTRKKKAHISKGKTGLRTKSNSSAESVVKAKQVSESANVSRRTEKQKLRDQLKDILLNAGWTIDLRPRRGRNYEDSVYIPPEGHGGYWSITKAYAVYQERLKRTNKSEGKISSGRNCRTPSVSDPIIPLESLDLLKRVVVNKRRRRIEESEESPKYKGKKVKKKSDKRHPRDQATKGKLTSDSKFSVGSTSYKNHHNGRSRQRGCTLLARGINHKSEADDADYVTYRHKRTVLSWMIDVGVLPINGKVKYMNQRMTKTKLEGWITRDGINCSCCGKILSLSNFGLHAGNKLIHPSQNIFLEDGEISLLKCQLEAWKKQGESERQGFYNIDVNGDDPNDDTCGICGDGGPLICCDGCPSTFHLACLGIEKPPPGDWHCTNCCCRFCGQISTDPSSASYETVSLLLSCHQCEAKYHEDCIPETEYISATSKSTAISFCSSSCRKVFRGLKKILGMKNDIESGFSWTVVRRFDEDSSKSPLQFHQTAESNSKIAVALAVMDECFLPIVDRRSGINLIHNVVYNCGSNFSRLNYSGFYTFILEHGDEIISVASIRIHGTRLAEMPFIGTRNMYRRQGMCRRLLSGIESVLSSLNIEKLVIPAISELKETWTNVFSFKQLEVSQELEVRSINILVFPGTGLLQKPLLENHSSKHDTPVDEVGVIEYDIKDHQDIKSAHDSSELIAAEAEPHNSAQAVGHCGNATEDSSFISDDSADPINNGKSSQYLSVETAGDACTNILSRGGKTSFHSEEKSEVDLTTVQTTELIGNTSDIIENKIVAVDAVKDQQECDIVSNS